MELEKKLDFLKQTGLLSLIDEATQRQLAETCREIELKAGEQLFEEGSRETAMYLILSGEIIVSKGNKQIARLGAGQYLGEMALIDAKPRSASASALQDSLLMEITEDQFTGRIASHPLSLIALMKTMSGRIRHDLEVMSNDLRTQGIFTHDIKNNLTPLGLSEMELRDLIEKFRGTQPHHKPRQGLEDLEYAYEILSQVVTDLTELVNQSLLHMKKIEMEYKKQKTEILPLIQETIKGISCHKYLTGKKVKVKPAGDLPLASMNALDIRRVIQNLVINAGYVTEDNGTIDIVAAQDGDALRVSVIDRGCGIPEDLRERLLTEPITTKKDGNGLGLLSCKEIVEDRHRGRFWFESEVGRGTTFHFTLPLGDPGEGH